MPIEPIGYTQYFGTQQTDCTYLHFDFDILPLQILTRNELSDTISIDDFTQPSQHTMNRRIRSFYLNGVMG